MLNVLTKLNNTPYLPTYPNFLGHEAGTAHVFHLGLIINFLFIFRFCFTKREVSFIKCDSQSVQKVSENITWTCPYNIQMFSLRILKTSPCNIRFFLS